MSGSGWRARRCKQVFCCALITLLCSSAASAAEVRVSIRSDSPLPLGIGERATLSVEGTVIGAAGNDDGIFTFDLDLLLVHPAQPPSPLIIRSIHRPNVNDELFGGSNGRAIAGGIAAIHGGYADRTRGVANPTVIFTAEVEAVSEGSVLVAPAPSIDPYGVDLLTHRGGPAATLYSGLTITVVPESIGILPAGALLLLRRNRRFSHTRA